jgi:DNA repair exonuclease SbcCD ATPase subunit
VRIKEPYVMVGQWQKRVLAHERNGRNSDFYHSALQNEAVWTMRELRSLQAENTSLKQQKFSLEIRWSKLNRLKQKRLEQLKQSKQLKQLKQTPTDKTVKTDGFFGRKSEADWEKEWRRLDEIDRVRCQDQRLWTRMLPGVLEEIEALEQQNARLRTEIHSLEDTLAQLEQPEQPAQPAPGEKLETGSTNLYLVTGS